MLAASSISSVASAAFQLSKPLAAAVEAIRWPAQPPPSLLYLPLDTLAHARRLNQVPLTQEAEAIAADIDGTIEQLGGSDFARVAVALLLLGGGGADECHALVTPLSWPDGTTFGGPPVDDSPAAAEATHAHALVHRQEAFHVGEFGTGWRNSAFWYGMAGELPKQRTARMRALAVTAASGDPERERWVEANLPTQDSWAPKALNGLLNDAIMDARAAQQQESGKLTPSMRAFAEELSVIELRVLLDDCLEQAAAGA